MSVGISPFSEPLNSTEYITCEHPSSEIGSNPWPPTGDVFAYATTPLPNAVVIVTFA